MIHIEGEDNILDDDDDMMMSHQLKTFLDDLKQIGPYSKQILNYSYPPLLYQRGDDEEDEDDDEGLEGLNGDDGLPDFRDELDDDED